ncbi:MAG: hypothetical protein CVU57_29790 [Deltaproteobacteria bacterium HGW-Deltaproteobacteria-15]|jgi:hypothetical protein|nr:MAG: hypothetical protein CVU57_29790 [Deltaproteobacteria bacterium HGW-Deltaproteobacteria-15]
MKTLISLWIKNRTQATIWFLCLFLTGTLWTLPVIDSFFPQVSLLSQKVTTGKILLTQCLIILALVASLITLHIQRRRTIQVDDYEYMVDPGVYMHKKTKEFYCGRCFDEGKLRRLSFHQSENVLICRYCKESYMPSFVSALLENKAIQ